ncbi:ABC transporter ATP-binding protein [Phytoactinopolyspora limicola]|uniref:ABC transporter ATP-binding protein n=1 Tax=Phytoactinopolyspora limicola TaxID=2715536 RepID=UPI00140ADCFE|nr:ABC transporter ATP-binding protein [Phytoactinopolyspora limicola]
MITARGLTKRYGDTTAVDTIDFTVAPGTVTGFLGPNGAGKSTTMRMVLGLDRPSAGSVTVNGRSYRDHPAPLREVGALLEAKAIHGGRSAYHHLLWLAKSNGIPRRRVDEVIGLVGLDEVAGQRAGTFSLGMGQRLGIAAALLGDPDVLLFDEPVNGLDPEGIRWIRTLIRNLAADGRTVFVSSHLMSEMALTADHLLVVGRGRILADTSMAGFIAENSTEHVYVRSPHGARLTEELRAAGWRVEATDDGGLAVYGADLEQVGAMAGSHGLHLYELRKIQASLEEAFMRLTAESVEFHAGVPTVPEPAAAEATTHLTPAGV